MCKSLPPGDLGNGNGELRFATLARACGFNPLPHSHEIGINDCVPIPIGTPVGKGIWHPIKWSINEVASQVSPTVKATLTTLIFRILPPPPYRSPRAIETHAGLEIRDFPPVVAQEDTVRDKEIAASLAHAQVMRVFLDSDADFAVVLEDDALLAADRSWMAFTDYDLFLPYAHNREHRPPDTRIRDGVLPQFGAFAYLCSREFATWYLPRLLAGEVADHAMQRAARRLRRASFSGNLVNHDNECVSGISESRRMMFVGVPSKALFDPKAKVVTGIVSCQARAQHRDAIRSTFLDALPSPVFIVGNPDSETRTEGDTLLLKCDDTYEGLPQKLWTFNYRFEAESVRRVSLYAERNEGQRLHALMLHICGSARAEKLLGKCGFYKSCVRVHSIAKL